MSKKYDAVLRALRGMLDDLPPAPTAGSRGWIIAWSLHAEASAEQETLPREAPHGTGSLIVFRRHAEAFGISDRPDVAGALDALHDALLALVEAPLGTRWDVLQVLKEKVDETRDRAGVLIGKAMGAPEGPLGPPPPGGREKAQLIARQNLDRVHPEWNQSQQPPTPAGPTAPTSPLGPLGPIGRGSSPDPRAETRE